MGVGFELFSLRKDGSEFPADIALRPVPKTLVVADRLYDDTGAVIGTAGYYIDLGADLAEQRQAVLGETLPDVVGARAVIEQAKGALMLVYGITAEDAFAILRWRSQETNSKLRELAAKLTTALTTLDGGPRQQRTQFDHLLLTTHQHPAPPTSPSGRPAVSV